MVPGPPHVVEALGDMLLIKRMAGLHFYEQVAVYEEICFIISDTDPVIENLDAVEPL
jgi:hypothetical protein